MDKKLLILLVPLMVLLVAGVAQGALTCTFDQTATTVGTSSTYLRNNEPAGTDLGGLNATNISVAMSGWVTENSNLTAGVISISSGTITGALVYNCTQIQCGTLTNSTYMNFTVALDQLFDTNEYTLTATVYNSTPTGQSAVTCTRAYYTDLGVPQCVAVYPNESYPVAYPTGITFIASAANATSCKVKVGNVYTGTVNGSDGAEDCYKDFGTGHPPQTIYDTVTYTTEDGLNISTCTSTKIFIDDEEYRGRSIALGTAAQQSYEASTKGTNIGLLLIIGLVVYVLATRKKK